MAEHCEFLGFMEEVGLWELEEVDAGAVATWCDKSCSSLSYPGMGTQSKKCLPTHAGEMGMALSGI